MAPGFSRNTVPAVCEKMAPVSNVTVRLPVADSVLHTTSSPECSQASAYTVGEAWPLVRRTIQSPTLKSTAGLGVTVPAAAVAEYTCDRVAPETAKTCTRLAPP